MKINTILISFLITILISCKEKTDSKSNRKLPKKEIQKKPVKTNNTKYRYVVSSGSLHADSKINYNSIIDPLNLFEPVELIEEYKHLKERMSYGSNDELVGYVCKVKTLEGKIGFIQSFYLRTYDELAERFDMSKLDDKSIVKNGKLSEGEASLKFINALDDKPSKDYFYTIANRLSLRDAPSLNSKRITVLKYLEPLELIENYPNKKEVIFDDEDGKVEGNWCKVKLLNGTEGYVFNGYLKKYEELSSKLIPKGIEVDEYLINGELKSVTTLKRFLQVMGKPDSIKRYKVVNDDFSDKQIREFKNGTLYITQITDQFMELGDGGWVYDDFNMKHYYKDGIEYEELNGEASFVDIDFTINNNYLLYNGFKIDSTTTLKTIAKIFPVQTINKWWRFDKQEYERLYEFGVTRKKNEGSEIGYNLYTSSTKTYSFNVYWYD